MNQPPTDNPPAWALLLLLALGLFIFIPYVQHLISGDCIPGMHKGDCRAPAYSLHHYGLIVISGLMTLFGLIGLIRRSLATLARLRQPRSGDKPKPLK